MTTRARRAGRRNSFRQSALILTLLFAATLLLGCAPLIEVVPPATPVASPVATVAPDERNVAIMGVDFDPPLEAGQLLASGGVTLLVALENQGRAVEPALRVTARLSDPQAGEAGAELANETVIVRGLNPGELRIVRFTQVTELPARMHYALQVNVEPVPGEQELTDNAKTYDILVRDGE